MADSTVTDVSKMKVIDLRKELKSRGLPHAGDKAELVARLQAAISQDDHGDINLDSDEIDSDGVLEDEDDKNHTDILDDSAVDTINEELALADNSPSKDSNDTKQHRILKRKISENDKSSKNGDNKDAGSRKIVLNRATSVTLQAPKPVTEVPEEKPLEEVKSRENTKVRITAEIDPKTRLEMRAKRFGLPVKMTEAERKEARKQRFGQNTSSAITGSSGSLSENLDKLKQRAERFGQSVSKIMTDIENKEKIEKRKAKFGTIE
ncbi:unnamed protein product [Diatraea saccharalis]|uniref:SAP domain-containing protein n=1 Tax=Diatraea saccharalis TaxID=40085 RepID=A0A9N9RBW2_9NEOP|nr:unnamed protein product [Diatraea saccharalis]